MGMGGYGGYGGGMGYGGANYPAYNYGSQSEAPPPTIVQPQQQYAPPPAPPILMVRNTQELAHMEIQLLTIANAHISTQAVFI